MTDDQAHDIHVLAIPYARIDRFRPNSEQLETAHLPIATGHWTAHYILAGRGQEVKQVSNGITYSNPASVMSIGRIMAVYNWPARASRSPAPPAQS